MCGAHGCPYALLAFSHRFVRFLLKGFVCWERPEREKRESFSSFNLTDRELLIQLSLSSSSSASSVTHQKTKNRAQEKGKEKRGSDPYAKNPISHSLIWRIRGSNAFILTCIALFLLDPRRFHFGLISAADQNWLELHNYTVSYFSPLHVCFSHSLANLCDWCVFFEFLFLVCIG